MKNSITSQRAYAKGFTLIEVLVTISIMVVLLGLSFGIGKWALENAQVQKAVVQVKLMERAIEEYKLDNGEFPPGDGSVRSTSSLYDALYERGVLNSGKVYMPEFDPDGSDQFREITEEGVVFDPFKKNKKPYFYLRGVDENGERVGSAYNPDFDLWSVGLNGRGRGSDEASEEDTEDDITNWD